MKSKLSFKEAYFLISHGLSSRDSEKITGISSSTINLVNKNYGLNKAFNKNKHNALLLFYISFIWLF